MDRSLTLQEERALKMKAAAANCALKLTAASVAAAAGIFSESHDDDLSSDTESDTDTCTIPIPSEFEVGPSTRKFRKVTTKGTMDVITAEFAAALDQTNTNDRKAAHIFSAIASTGQLQYVRELVISHSAIRRAKMKYRELFISEIKGSFNPAVPLVLHWDGKIKGDWSRVRLS